MEYTQAARAARQAATGYLSRDQIPRESEDMVKRYFDRVQLDPADEPAAP